MAGTWLLRMQCPQCSVQQVFGFGYGSEKVCSSCSRVLISADAIRVLETIVLFDNVSLAFSCRDLLDACLELGLGVVEVEWLADSFSR